MCCFCQAAAAAAPQTEVGAQKEALLFLSIPLIRPTGVPKRLWLASQLASSWLAG